MIASSFAAAWSSKPKPTQKRLRSASPQARLILEPKGACTTSCIPPLSSKKRSRMTRRCVGTAPRAFFPASTYSASCTAAASGRASPHSACSDAAASPFSRSVPISAASSRVRPGASPSQNGIEGGCPLASATRTIPGSIRRTRQEAFPS